MVMQKYGGPDHGKRVVETLDEAIEFLLSVHTRQSFDGGLAIHSTPDMPATEKNKELYARSWAIMHESIHKQMEPPTGEINEAWIRESEQRIESAAAVILDRDRFRALLSVARNGLRPKSV
jgi:hypothetical protein